MFNGKNFYLMCYSDDHASRRHLIRHIGEERGAVTSSLYISPTFKTTHVILTEHEYVDEKYNQILKLKDFYKPIEQTVVNAVVDVGVG